MTNFTIDRCDDCDDNCDFDEEMDVLIMMDESILGTVFRYFYFVGVFGNVLVIIYFTKQNHRWDPRKLSPYHYLVIQLAFVDLLMCACAVAEIWTYSQALMIFYQLTYSIITSLSCWTIVMMSLERHRGILHPFRAKIRKWRFLLASISIAVIVLIINVVYYLCIPKFNVSEIGATIVYTFLIEIVIESFLPVACICVLYRRMAKALRSTGQKAATTTTSDVISNHVRLRRNKTAVLTLKWLTIVYIFCVVPSRTVITILIVLQMNDMVPGPYYSWIPQMEVAIECLIYVNNTVNVFIYARMVVGFRRFLVRTVTCGCYPTRRGGQAERAVEYHRETESSTIMLNKTVQTQHHRTSAHQN